MDLCSLQLIRPGVHQKMQPEIAIGWAFVWRCDLLSSNQCSEDMRQSLLKVYQLPNSSSSHPCFQKQSYRHTSDSCFRITLLQNCNRIILFQQECLRDNS